MSKGLKINLVGGAIIDVEIRLTDLLKCASPLLSRKYISLMPCPFTSPKMFCACPNFLSQPNNLTAFSASSTTFVLAQKPILMIPNHLFVWHKMFVTATICKWIFGLAQKIWTSPKHFGSCKRTRHQPSLLFYWAALVLSPPPSLPRRCAAHRAI